MSIREMPLAEALKYQIQVQRKLQEQLEVRQVLHHYHDLVLSKTFFHNTTSAYVCNQVQKKLQMRIEAQGKYLKAIIEKAERNISFDASAPSDNIESTRSQPMDFNLALSGFMDNATRVCEENNDQLEKAISDDNHKDNLGFQLYQLGSQEAKKDKWTPKTEDSLRLDLNIKGGYDLSSRGMQACELDLKINQ